MRFLVKHTGQAEQRLLKYVADEYSFDIEPIVHIINFDVIVNKLNLTVVNDNKVAQVWGFCPYTNWIKSNCNVPQYTEGLLIVMDNLESGFSYGINSDDEWPVYVNQKTGWICVGNPERSGEAVEFMNNCVAVVDNNNKLVSLWLKPQELPLI